MCIRDRCGTVDGYGINLPPSNVSYFITFGRNDRVFAFAKRFGLASRKRNTPHLDFGRYGMKARVDGEVVVPVGTVVAPANINDPFSIG